MYALSHHLLPIIPRRALCMYLYALSKVAGMVYKYILMTLDLFPSSPTTHTLFPSLNPSYWEFYLG